LNATVLYFVVLNVTRDLLISNCTEIAMSYESRLGSVLATDLTLWLTSSLTGKPFCYKGRSLLPPKEPHKIAKAIVNLLMKKLPKVKNIEDLRIKGEWYYVMLSSTQFENNAKKALSCLKEYEDLRALYCFLELKGYYERVYEGKSAIVNVPCLFNLTDPGERWAVASLAKRVRGGNLTLALNLLYSYYAYALYYKKDDTRFVKQLLGLLVTEACSPLEVTLCVLCKLAWGSRWHECYALTTFLYNFKTSKK